MCVYVCVCQRRGRDCLVAGDTEPIHCKGIDSLAESVGVGVQLVVELESTVVSSYHTHTYTCSACTVHV